MTPEQLSLFGASISVPLTDADLSPPSELSYHNSTGEDGSELERYEALAGSQDALVLGFFRRADNATSAMTPSTVHWHLINEGLITEDTPITSIRRAISNLTKRGVLRKTKDKELGPYKRPESLSELIQEEQTVEDAR